MAETKLDNATDPSKQAESSMLNKDDEQKAQDPLNKTETIGNQEQSLDAIESISSKEIHEPAAENNGITKEQSTPVEKTPVSSSEPVQKEDIVKSNDEVANEKSNSDSTNLQKQKAEGENIESIISEEEQKLNEILKVVHEDLGAQNVQKTPTNSTTTINESTTNEDDIKKCISEVKVEMESEEKKKANVHENVPEEIETITLTTDTEPKEHVEKLEDRSEVGIVGPPTAVSELINEEELRAESALSTEQKVQDHVAEWVQNSVKAEGLVNVEAEEEETAIRDNGHHGKKSIPEKRMRKKKNNDVLVLPTRKSQRIVTNIIKKSIKW
ncbi:hypothetical protein KM043_015163 [Ampulex compressa]|nr:hypothetical protein KM043_015163 [Ampulex compressa]